MTTMKDRPQGDSHKAAVHPVDEFLAPQKLVVLGLQHLFIMYAGAVAVPLIVGGALGLKAEDIAILVSADLLVSGIATLIQSIGIRSILGVRLPVVAGATFTVLNPMIIIAGQYGLPAVYGAMLCAGVFGLIIAKPFSAMIRFFPPLVTGTVITIIGLSLVGADAGLITGKGQGDNPTSNLPFVPFQPGVTVTDGDFKQTTTYGGSASITPHDYGLVSHIALAGLVILVMILIARFFKGFIGQISVLIGIIVGTLVAWPMGLLDFSAVHGSKWVGIAEPFHFGHPKFVAAAIISMCIVILVTYTESTADMLAVAEMVDRPLTSNDLARGLATDGLSALLAGFMNSFPDTAYAENVGLIEITKIKSRWVVATCGLFLTILGLIPKMGAVVAGLPGPVIGGAGTVMFAMVTAIGIRTLNKVEYEDNHNLLIIAVSLSVGMLPVIAPDFYRHFPNNFQTIFGSAITSTVVVVFMLNLVFNHWVRKPKQDSLMDTALDAGAVTNQPASGVPNTVIDG
ncbi:NCS2 family nucleobase:cation symporter-2 [Jatrophihabitans sp. GAS493]|uniref:nucleobase:cation symporter-2 family protein n=1 Tax=Jatrophihabitans sp. GAS493 TaxID=1907575 RepID=UPI000BC0A7B4|nr:nucleobase:cation symporter-2 family protein [Jatrophihabitans sp. GAS493]SOD71126.1 NCS2 family nucleobase:cation symporter-2 [Jatrophihabitans sp. GAS493]